jgi:hypothetical protein
VRRKSRRLRARPLLVAVGAVVLSGCPIARGVVARPPCDAGGTDVTCNGEPGPDLAVPSGDTPDMGTVDLKGTED